jgi:hypothetical protein
VCIMAPEPMSIAYFINSSNQSLYLYMCPLIVARQWIGKSITAATNTRVTIEQFLDASFSLPQVSYQKKAGY